MKLSRMMPRTRLEWVEKLAGAGLWIANGAGVFLAFTSLTEWTAVAAGCLTALAVVNAVAGIRRLSAGQRPGVSRLERVEKLARAGMWIASGVAFYLASTQPDWRFVPAGCGVALAGVYIAANFQLRLAGQRVEPGKGSGRSGHGQNDRGGGVSGHGRDGDAGPAAEAVYRRRTLAVVSRLMPASAGRRWLAEAESLLSEVPAARRGPAVRSYLLSAPRLTAMMWVREAGRRARLGPRRPG